MNPPRFPYHPCPRCRDDVADGGGLALDVRGVSAAYPSEPERLALDGVSLRVPAGAHVALVGPNGAGKSTLLKAIAGLLPLRAGEIRVHGQPVAACLHRVVYLPQRGEIDWRFPIEVEQLVMTGRYVHLGWLRWPGAEDRRRVAAALERLGIAHLADRQIGQLSGGQQQRTLLARALAQDADLLLLDEPLNAVDAETRAAVGELMRELRREGKTVVAATHDLGRIESDFDGALFLSDGREVPAPPGWFVGPPLEGFPVRPRGAGAVWA
ncbi:MAG TPA: ABC transporter ATP-binding protein [Chloroflexota bacterium]|jgi:manganese/zinc/iron transport system ATP- binding protein|nr:ABC transporter ATP-binding protein [Chloroflexota bacterium]